MVYSDRYFKLFCIYKKTAHNEFFILLSSLEKILILIALLFSPIDLLPEHQEHIDNVSYFYNLFIIEFLFCFYALFHFFYNV